MLKSDSLTSVTHIEEHPQFSPRNRKSVWIFKIDEPFCYKSNIKGHTFQARWLSVQPDGTITIPAGYAWDGCSPKLDIADVLILGTPDGIVDIASGKPKTYHASLVHDALYQYFRWHNIERREIDRLFLEIMRQKQFLPAILYFWAVRIFGVFFVKRKVEMRRSVEFALSKKHRVVKAS